MENVKAIDESDSDSKKICIVAYIRGRGIVPKDSDEIEIFDEFSYKFPIEKFIKQFALVKNCSVYIYLECPRDNPKRLVPSKAPIIPKLNLD